MKRFRLFVENFIVYGMGSVISNVIPLVMLPIITRIIPNSSVYGISDLANTIVSFVSAFALMGIYDAVFRMFFDKDDETFKKSICSTGLFAVIVSSTLLLIIMIVFQKSLSQLFFADEQYTYVIWIAAVTMFINTTNTIVSAPTRMQNKRMVFLAVNTISPIISYGVAVVLILRGYYIIALPMGAMIAGILKECVFGILNQKWFSIHRFDWNLFGELLKIGLPCVPSFLIYWVFSSCDKIMITQQLGVAESGVYSIGAKLGLASQLIYTAFVAGWQYFAFSTMQEKDQVEANSKIYEYLGIISFAAGMFVCAWSYSIYKILFPEEYLRGYIISPYLFLAPLLQMLYQVVGNQFLVIKKTWPSPLVLSAGAVINIVLNYVLIPICGIEGAAIATLLGYVFTNILADCILCRMGLMIMSKRFILSVGIMIVYFMLWRNFFVENIFISTGLAIIGVVIFLLIYRSDVNILMKKDKKE